MLQLNDKLVDTLALSIRPYCRVLTHEGTARSAKTAIAIQEFYYNVWSSEEKYHAVCARDLDTIKDNILYASDVGLLISHPDCRLTSDRIGGNYVLIPSPKGDKHVKLVNYSNVTAWKKVLGNSLGVVLIDEVNTSDQTFVSETFARQIKANRPLTLLTLNGDDPNHSCYQNYINYSRIVGDCPASIQAEMVRFQKEHGSKEGFFYSHFAMADNPVMTPEKIARAHSIYPPGSFYYITKILGERGVQGQLIFDDYLNEQLIVDPLKTDSENRRLYPFSRFTIGVDIGETKAHNVFVLVGWLPNYAKAVVLDFRSFLKVGYAEKTARLHRFLEDLIRLHNLDPARIEGVFIDSAEGNYISDLKDPLRREFGLTVTGSYKATVKDRIDMNIVGFSTGRVLFSAACRKIYDAYRSARWADGKVGKEREDLNLEINDLMDATEYALTRHMKALMYNG